MNITDICNMALSSIAQGRIASLDEDSEAARQCGTYYDILRKSLLSSFRWGFAERSRKLAEIDTDLPGWDYAYAVPTDCLIVRQIYNRSGKKINIDAASKDHTYHQFKISLINESTKVIGVDIEEAWLDYTADITNAEMFNPHFVEALAHKLASAISMPLSGSLTMVQSEYQQYQAAIQEAMLDSAIQNHHEIKWSSTFFDARRGL